MKKNKISKIIYLVFLFFGSTMIAQHGFCDGNFFANGDFEIGTPTNISNNITLASGWDKIWNGNSEADYYDATSTAVNSLPIPASGDYGSFWIDNRLQNTSTWREGLLNQLATPVPINSGNYSFSFDLACLHGWGGAEIGVYAVYDPNYPGTYTYPTAPISSHNPTNLNLYSNSGLSQEIALLGIVPVPTNCNGQKQNMNFMFNSNNLGLSGDITHIVITRSATVISGSKYIGVDNFCMLVDTSTPVNDGAYCCDSKNLVPNGNFEDADAISFRTSYSPASSPSSIYPGQFSLTTSTAAFGTTVTDHSFCEDPTVYSSNNTFLVINGHTQQTSSAIIWDQNVSGLIEGESYKVCANFKNLPQCTFDILPKITISAGGQTSSIHTINTDENDPCDWQNVSFNFTASGSTESIKIYLEQNGNGDGNDLAIDDISVSQLEDPNIAFTVQHQQNPSQVTASINTISPGDDNDIPCGNYSWHVAKNLSTTQLDIDLSTLGSGDVNGSMLPPSASIPGAAWNTTTNFPGYTFDPNTLYYIGLYTPKCDCNDEGFEYQLTFSSRSGNEIEITEKQKEEVLKKILERLEKNKLNRNKASNQEINTITNQFLGDLVIHPNPAKNMITLSTEMETMRRIEIYTSDGRLVKDIESNNTSESIHISTLDSGMYLIKVYGISNKVYTSKFVKK